MWPFDIFAKRRAAEEAQKQWEEYSAMRRRQRDAILRAQKRSNWKAEATASPSPSVSNDMLNPMSLSNPLNPIYNTSYSAPSHESHPSRGCDFSSSDSSSYSSSYDSSSSSSDCGSPSSSSSFD